jgi:predicted permease
MGLLQDVRYALRQLRKSPGFSIATVLTLTLAIGVATAAFSVLYAVLIRPLPFNQPNRIVRLNMYSPQGFSQPASYEEYVAWRRDNHTLEALSGYLSYSNINLERTDRTIALNKVVTSDNFFSVFGVPPLLGRTFLPGEDQAGQNDMAVLSYEVWQEEFGGRREVIGETARLDGRPFTIIGVMPSGFRYPLHTRKAVYVPLHTMPVWVNGKGHWLGTIARLKSGISLKQAQADIDRAIDNLVNANQVPRGRRIVLQELASAETGYLVAPFRALVLAVLAVFGIGCSNIAGLLLARGVKRSHETGIRIALGANRPRIARQLLTETFLFCLAGAAGGVMLAYALLGATRIFLVRALARGVDVQIDKAALLVALGLALLTTLLSGLIPAWRLSTVAPNRTLKAGEHSGSTRSQQRLRACFVVAQVATAFVLLIAFGLMLRSLRAMLHTDVGFSTNHLLAVDVAASSANYQKRDIIANLYDPLLEKVRAIPGVQEAGMISMLPVREAWANQNVHIVGHPPDPPNQERLAEFRLLTPGYFKALGLKLVRGRMLDQTMDRHDSRIPGLVVNEAFVKRFLAPGEDPIGKQIERSGVIVGVVQSARQDLQYPPLAEMDFLISQVEPKDRAEALQSLCMVIRTEVDPESIIPSLRLAFHQVDPSLPFTTPVTMPDVIADKLLMERFQNWVFGTFAALAVLLAIIGLYGLISQDVELSTRDIGVRMALGASPLRTSIRIYRRVLLLLATGLVTGLLATLLLRSLLAAVVVISPGKDSSLILALAAGLLVTGLVVTLLPVRRAASVNPVTALRYE